MSNYDFSSLNDKEFEVLAADLLSTVLNVRVERFKPGIDQGVDGRFFVSDEQSVIQCKHWMKSGLKQLKNHLKRVEFDKVDKLKPARYILVTSLELSRTDKNEIQNIFFPYIKCPNDVWGKEDLNDHISKHPILERRHHNLWMTSSSVLSTLLNNAVYGRSNFILNEIVDKSNLYIETSSFRESKRKLIDNNSLIIKGAPGIGKSTLAEQLSKYFAAIGYEFVYIENSIKEAEDIFNPNEPQVFYYDDFLGRNFLMQIDDNKDSHIVNFIKRVERANNKKFILTTRTNILNRGKQLSELFEREGLDQKEYEISIQNISSMDKGKILYNHIWHGELNEQKIEQIYKDDRYLQVINHKNFNPRLISFTTEFSRVEHIPDGSYWEYISNTLKNPKDVWSYAFRNQLSDIGRYLVMTVALNGKKVTENELIQIFNQIVGSDLYPNCDVSFTETIRHLIGSFLNRNAHSESYVSYDLFNPSIADFIYSEYTSNYKLIYKILRNLKNKESIGNISSMVYQSLIKKEDYNQIMLLLIQDICQSKDALDLYESEVFYNFILINDFDSLPKMFIDRQLVKFTSEFSFNREFSSKRHVEVMRLMAKYGYFSGYANEVMSTLQSLFQSGHLFTECYLEVYKMLSSIEDITEEHISNFQENVLTQVSNYITEMVIDNGVCGDCYNHSEFDFSDVYSYLESFLPRIGIFLTSDEINDLAFCCDENEVIDHNRSSEGDYEIVYGRDGIEDSDFLTHIKDINDYFERA
ncbi:hypothetical protein MACH09_30770 [Vibrio sp. MACH09]|uniref:nSTAND3 domain-containing NTPase n=1 Tax=Vibrio sp. MACH09 TaxID=3025122 RepID=UPI00278EC3A2|nr:restriction endonuclease [Vibrio sp. MACH09]GLO62569.1 hypothetical protein MACH09_30770 [Vibrio sp. MACH09]